SLAVISISDSPSRYLRGHALPIPPRAYPPDSFEGKLLLKANRRKPIAESRVPKFSKLPTSHFPPRAYKPAKGGQARKGRTSHLPTSHFPLPSSHRPPPTATKTLISFPP